MELVDVLHRVLVLGQHSEAVGNVLQAVVSDIAGYDQLYKRLITRISLTDVSASFVMEKIKETTALPIDSA